MDEDAAAPLPPLDETALRIVTEFERAWTSDRPTIRPFLEKHPARPLRLLVELAAIDLEHRVKRGEDATPERYEAEFPELATDAACVAELRRAHSRGQADLTTDFVTGHDQSFGLSSDHAADDRPMFLKPSATPGALGTLAHYTVLRRVGNGAFGTVFEAFDEKLHRRVAIKVLNPQLATTAAARQRFIREARSMAAVTHENVVRVYAVEDQPVPYMVMEYVDGETLQDRMDRDKPLGTDLVVHLTRQVAAALAAAHAIGLVHRDVKPANVLLERGSTPTVKLTDFGLARAVDDASLTRSGTVVGTPMYMSPEQALGSTVDHRTDLFSLGSLMYVMTSGQAPFRAPSTVAVLKRLVDETPQPIAELIPGTPQWLVDLIQRLHAKNPDERIQTAREVERLLAKAQTEGAVEVEQPAGATPAAAGHTPEATAAGNASHLPGWVAAAVAVAVTALVGAAMWYRGAGKTAGVASVPTRQQQVSPTAPVPPLAVAPFDTTQATMHQEAWATHLGIPVHTTNSIGQTLVLIPSGQFMMGEEDKVVEATLTKPFSIAQTEVTQGQWKQVMGTSPWKGKPYTIEGADVAATFVSWHDAVAFCEKLTAQERRSGAITGYQQYRLPTEAEWEWACRAGTDTMFSFGEDEDIIGDYAWFGGGWQDDPVPGGNTTGEMYAHAVRLKRPNPFGLYDIHGNAWEWCGDWQADHGDAPETNPRAPTGRVPRGGCWYYPAVSCRSADRGELIPTTTRYNSIGFRPVLSPPQ